MAKGKVKRQEWKNLSCLIFIRKMDMCFPYSQHEERQVSTAAWKQPGRGNPTDCSERQTWNVPDNEKQRRSWKTWKKPPPQEGIAYDSHSHISVEKLHTLYADNCSSRIQKAIGGGYLWACSFKRSFIHSLVVKMTQFWQQFCSIILPSQFFKRWSLLLGWQERKLAASCQGHLETELLSCGPTPAWEKWSDLLLGARWHSSFQDALLTHKWRTASLHEPPWSYSHP